MGKESTEQALKQFRINRIRGLFISNERMAFVLWYINSTLQDTPPRTKGEWIVEFEKMYGPGLHSARQLEDLEDYDLIGVDSETQIVTLKDGVSEGLNFSN